jgi:glutamyl-tRNA reductase
MEILLVGINHTTAPVEVRERLAFSADGLREGLPRFLQRTGMDEALILSTCNRVEVLVVRHAPDFDSTLSGQVVMDALCDLRGIEGGGRPAPNHFFELHDLDAVRHLVRLSSGLESMILGEGQILGQLRDAYALAVEAGTHGRYTNKVFHLAFRAGKRVRTETELGFGGVSVASAAISLASKVFGDFSRHTACLIGAGEMAEAAARHLRERGIGNLLFVNRSLDKAEQLALEYDGEAIGFERRFEALEQADIVVSSTAAPGLILDHEQFHRVMDKRHTRPIFLVDIAVPRDIDPEINDHDNAFLYDIDSLREVADQNLDRRRRAIPAAERIVESELESFGGWLERLRVEPLVKQLHAHFDEVRRCEVLKNQGRFCEKESEDLEKLTRSIQKKLLHNPTRILRQCDPETDEGRRTLEIVRDLFGLK